MVPTGTTIFPSRAYTLAEANGAGFSTVNGFYVVGSVGYNPISNSFGGGVSSVSTVLMSKGGLIKLTPLHVR